MAKFIRKNIDAQGVYRLAVREYQGEDGVMKVEELKIEGRNIFETDDKRIIEMLKKDPEIEEVNKKTQIEANDK